MGSSPTFGTNRSPVSRADLERLTRRERALARRALRGDDVSAARDAIESAWRDATTRYDQRLALPLDLAVPPSLPIAAHVETLTRLFRTERAFVVRGETGSGKTTQLPKIALAAGRGIAGRIGHTQPRRIAARSAARRLADELGPDGRRAVGHTVRFDDTTTPFSRVQVMTDGMLLAAARRDPDLLAWDTILLDEAHERSRNIDFLLGLLKRLLDRRDDLCVVVTSATLDTDRFAEHFGGAPVVHVEGRRFPVEIRWRPPGTDDAGDPIGLEQAVEDALRELLSAGPGDVLVFLAGAREIADVADHLKRRDLGPIEILPLHASLPIEQQDRVFAPSTHRRVVLATNVAETSLTVPGIHYVIDAGRARILRYSPHARVQRLHVEPIAKDSAEQRAGRCGRLADGICVRLYAEDDFDRRDPHTAPEIQRSHLAGVILDMMALRLGPIEAFPFLDPPRPRAIREGRETLFELAATDEDGRLTELGRELARLPLDPRLARLLVEGRRLGCAEAMRVIVAVIEAGDPRERPFGEGGAADRAHARFVDPASDVMTLLKLHDAMAAEEGARSGRGFRAWCADHHLRLSRWREWSRVVRHLRERSLGPDEPSAAATRDPDRVHRALLPGFLAHVAARGDGHAYLGTHDTSVLLWPGSVLFRSRPPWIVSLERVDTGRTFARLVAPIRRAWIEPAATHLVRRRHRDPHWNERRGHVEAFERVTLGGLVVEPKRRVNYGPLHPRRAREIFIRHALVHRRYRSRAPWRRHIDEAIETIAFWRARLRRSDLELDAEDLFAFFDARIPATVVDARSFERWRAAAEAEDPRVLFVEPSALIGSPPPSDTSPWPDALIVGTARFDLRYRFAPGEPDDGITVRVPWPRLEEIPVERLEWLVPGFLAAKVEALLRTLPKELRRPLVPLPESARDLAARLTFGRGNLRVALAHALGSRAGREIRVGDFAPRAVPPDLVARVEVLDASGAVLAAGRDPEALRRQIRARRGSVLDAADRERGGDPARTWTFGALPEEVAVDHGGFTVAARPVLMDRGNEVRLALVDPGPRADRLHRDGVRRLLVLDQGVALRKRLESHPSWPRLVRLQSTRGSALRLARELVDLAIVRGAGLDDRPPRDAEAFRRAREALRQGAGAAIDDAVGIGEAILERYDAVARKLMPTPPPGYEAPVNDMIRQLARLVEEDVFADLPRRRLAEIPRYLDAIDARLTRIGYGGLGADRERQARIDPWTARLREAEAVAAEQAIDDPALDALRWALEEFRVAQFAQELGTRERVSEHRLETLWEQRRV